MEMADVTVHIDETLGEERLTEIASKLRAHNGVMGVAHREEKPHLMIVEYDPDRVSSSELLKAVQVHGIHAELIGL